MKKMSYLSYLSLIIALALVTLNGVASDPAKIDYSHTPTRVTVHARYEFHNGKYVWIPAHTAIAPSGHSYWASPGYVRHEDGYQPGHFEEKY